MKRIIFALSLAMTFLTAGFTASAKVSPQIFMDIMRYVSGDTGVVTDVAELDVNGDGNVTLADLNVAAVDLKKQVENNGYMFIVQRVVATPGYAFDNNVMPDEDVEMITLTWDDVDDYAIEKENFPYNIGMVEFKALGLEGKADDYFLCDIEMKLKKEESGNIKIVEAKSLGTKATVSFDDVEFGTVTGESSDLYYDPYNKQYKFINGKLTLGDYETYLFDAPYSFSQSYNTDKYNAKFIKFGKYEGDMESEDEADHVKFRYTYDSNANYVIESGDGRGIVGTCTEVVDADGEIVYEWSYDGYLSQLYFGGLGEIDVYDCNGDGKPEYLFVKDFCVGTIDDEEDVGALDIDYHPAYSAEDLLLYTDMSIVDGVEYSDGDIVVAYVNPDANYIKVSEILSGHTSNFEVIADSYFTLTTGEKVYFDDFNCVIYNEWGCLGDIYHAASSSILKAEFIVYFSADGRLVYATYAPKTFDPTKNYYIVLDEYTQTATTVVDGKLEQNNYIDVWNGEKVVSVKAKKVDEYSSVFDVYITPETQVYADGNYDFSDYVGKPATAHLDKDGRYYFKLVDFTIYDDDSVLRSTWEEEAEYRKQGGNIEFSLYHDNIFNLDGKKVYIRDYTKIIIKSYDNMDEVIVTAYSLDSLPDFADSIVFDNASYIIFNNLASSVNENLAFLYGEYDGVLKPMPAEVNEVRIITGGTYDESIGKCVYSAYNPYTGKMEHNLTANEDVYEFRTGAICGYDADGVIATEYWDWNDNLYNNGWALDLDCVTDSLYYDMGYSEMIEYDPDSGMSYLKDDDYIYIIDDDTVISFSNAEEGTFERVDKSIFTSTDSRYYQDDDRKNNLLRVFIGGRVDAKDEYVFNVDFAIVVRQYPEYVEIIKSESSIDMGIGVVLEDNVWICSSIVDGRLQRINYIDIYNNGNIVSVNAKKVDEYSSVYDVCATPKTYYRGSDIYDFSAYVNRLCDVKCDKEGQYYFRLWDFSRYNDISVLYGSDEKEQYRFNTSQSALYQNENGNIVVDGFSNNFILTLAENAEIIIRALDMDENDTCKKLKAEDIAEIPETLEFRNVLVVIENDASSNTTEKLLAFYGETDKCLFDSDTAEPVITSLGIGMVLSHQTFQTTEMIDGRLTISNYIELFDGEKIVCVKVRRISRDSEFYDYDTPVNYAYGTYDFSAYVNKLCQINRDDRGYYHFDILDFDSFNNEDVLRTDDETAEFRMQGDNIGLNYVTGNMYELTDSGMRVYVRDYTKIVIRHWDYDTDEWKISVFDANNLPDFKDGTKFYDVSCIIKNNTASVKNENLAYFYGTIDTELEFDLSVENNVRVVLSYSTYATADGKWFVYDLINPYTGKIESDYTNAEVPMAKFSRGDIVTVNRNREIDDELGAVGYAYLAGEFIDTSKDIWRMSCGYVYVAEYDEESGNLCVAANEKPTEVSGRYTYVLSDFIESEFLITDDTVVSFADRSEGTVKLLGKEALADTSKIYRQDDDRKRHLRVFMSATPDKSDPDVYTVDFAMIVRD